MNYKTLSHWLLGSTLSLSACAADSQTASPLGSSPFGPQQGGSAGIVEVTAPASSLPRLGEGQVISEASAAMVPTPHTDGEVADVAVPETMIGADAEPMRQASGSSGLYACGVAIESSAWRQQATAVVTPGLAGNPLDFGLFTEVSPIVGQAGALWFATNTAFCELVNCSVSGIADLATVQAQRVEQGIEAVALANTGTTGYGTLNIYNLTSGVAAQVHHVMGGGVHFILDEEQEAIFGEIALDGSSGFGGPGVTSRYTAQFSGRCQWIQ